AGGHEGQILQGRVDLRLALHEALDHSILEGVEADDRGRPAGGEGPERAGKATLELPELVVDEHAQRLERAGRRMLAGLARAHGGPDEGGELAGAGERMSAPRRDDGLRHPPRETLLS